MSNPNPLPKDPMPVRTPGLADALRRLAGDPRPGGPTPTARRAPSRFRSVDRVEGHLREFYGVVRRQTRLFTVVFVGVTSVLALLVATQTPTFESSALLLVKVGRELVYTPQVGDPKAISPQARDKATVINSEIAIMRSEPVLSGVVETVGLTPLYPDLGESLTEVAGEPEAEQVASMLAAKAVERLREALVVLALPETDVLQVAFRHPDGAIAQKSVSTLIDKFTQAHLEAFGDPQVVRFLESRIDSYRESLDEAEGRLRAFELEHPVFADESPQAAIAARLEELRRQIDASDAQITQVRLATVGENSALAQAQRDRLALEMEASKVKGHLRDTANRRIAVVKQFIGARQGELEAQVGTLQERRAQLQTELTETENERARLPTLASQYNDLRRERDAQEEQYNIYQKHLRDAKFSNQMDNEKIASISVVQKATLAPEPIWPLPPALGVVVVFVLAGIAAGLSAALAEHFSWTWPANWNTELVRQGAHRLAEQARRR